jgi:hypothetical protein
LSAASVVSNSLDRVAKTISRRPTLPGSPPPFVVSLQRLTHCVRLSCNDDEETAKKKRLLLLPHFIFLSSSLSLTAKAERKAHAHIHTEEKCLSLLFDYQWSTRRLIKDQKKSSRLSLFPNFFFLSRQPPLQTFARNSLRSPGPFFFYLDLKAPLTNLPVTITSAREREPGEKREEEGF